MYRLILVVALGGCSFRAASGTLEDEDPKPVDAAALEIDASVPPIDAPKPPIDAPAVPVIANIVAMADTWVESPDPDLVTGALDHTIVDGVPLATILMRFDLSGLAGKTIVKAELHIWSDFDTGAPCTLHRMMESWTEAAATYNRRAVGVAWAGVGASPPSRSTTVVGNVTPSVAFTEYTIAIDTALVADWVATPANNFGLAMASVNMDGARFSSREIADLGKRPFLRVTHVP